MQTLTEKQTYKTPITELGKNLLSKIETEQMQSAKVQFRVEQTSHHKNEVFFIGVRDKKELIKLIDFLCFYDKKIILKHVSAKSEKDDYYLLTINESLL